MCARVGESDRVEQRWDHGSEPSIAAYRIHQIEDEQRIALFQGVKVVEVEIDGYNLGGKAELGKRATTASAESSVSISSGRSLVAACTTGMKPPGFSAIRRVSALAPGLAGQSRNGQARH